MAEEVRDILSYLGVTELMDVIGRTALLERLPGETKRQQAVDLTELLASSGIQSDIHCIAQKRTSLSIKAT